MKLTEARTDLSIQREVKIRLGKTHQEAALQLAIEAIKEVERLRSYKAFHIVTLLPGETPED